MQPASPDRDLCHCTDDVTTLKANCDAANATMHVHIQTGKMFQKFNKWPIFSMTSSGPDRPGEVCAYPTPSAGAAASVVTVLTIDR
jgi:hypothetical protein